jgi:hypothetical protein
MMKWAENIAGIGRKRLYIGYGWEIQKEIRQYEDQDVGEWIILKGI